MTEQGTIFDIEKSEQGDWFPFFGSKVNMATGETTYDEPEEGAAEFRIRSTDPFWAARRKGRIRQSKMVLNPQTRSMERVTYFADLSPEEESIELEDAWDYAITGINGAFFSPGNPIECTRENKLRLRGVSSFFRYFLRVQEILDETAVKVRKEAEKN